MTPPPPAPTAPADPAEGDLVRRVLCVRPGEGVTLALSAVLFAWLLCAYYLLRPTREIFGIDDGPVYEWLWTGTAVGTLLTTPLFGWLASRFPRRVFVPAVLLGAAMTLVAFWLAHRATDGQGRLWIGYGFYVFVSVLAVFATAVFWGFMADGWRDEQARRLFGLVAVGGTVGALIGSAVADALLDVVAPRDLILCGAGLYASSIVFVAPLSRRFGGAEASPGTWVPQIGWRAALDGVRLFASSRYLLAIGAFLAAQTLANTFLYLQSRTFTHLALPVHDVAPAVAEANRVARGEFFATVDFTYNALAILVQLFLVGRLVRWIGIGAMLATLPLVSLGGFAMLAVAPSLLAYGAFEVLSRGSRFAVMKPAREMLFTVLSRDEKYKAKQFLDTAVYRSTDAFWVWLDAGLGAVLGPAGLTFGFLIPACAGWTLLAWWLGRMNGARREQQAPEVDSRASR